VGLVTVMVSLPAQHQSMNGSLGRWQQLSIGRAGKLSGLSLHLIYLVGRRNRQYDSMNESIDFSHACLRGASFLAETVADYCDVNMNSSDLRSADLGLAKLENANLMGATLDDALIISAKLHGARLTYAHMWRAGLSGADLRGAHVANADLRSANLCNADLSDADLSGANLTDVVYDSTTIWPRGFQPPPSRPTVC
jgi:uncharacterized protein YjbI with pentapeptide repeats